MKREVEEWRDVVDYEGLYKVSNQGNISITRKDGKLISQCKNNFGRLLIYLRKDGKSKTLMVHKLVAIAFLGHKPCGHKIVVDHIDNNKLNNRLDNLQLITQRENISKDRKPGSSKYIGVSSIVNSLKWRAQIYDKGTRYNLGCFEKEIDAHNAYQNALKELP